MWNWDRSDAPKDHLPNHTYNHVDNYSVFFFQNLTTDENCQENSICGNLGKLVKGEKAFVRFQRAVDQGICANLTGQLSRFSSAECHDWGQFYSRRFSRE